STQAQPWDNKRTELQRVETMSISGRGRKSSSALRRLLRDECGVSAVEYGMMVAAVAALVVIGTEVLERSVKTNFTSTASNFQTSTPSFGIPADDSLGGGTSGSGSDGSAGSGGSTGNTGGGSQGNGNGNGKGGGKK
ncbi:MAG: Flp family type IVb pilin, partial [Rhodospirillales bacterium]|nr:Flp family type IVb pilin [Rhodospirillales bacterium]